VPRPHRPEGLRQAASLGARRRRAPSVTARDRTQTSATTPERSPRPISGLAYEHGERCDALGCLKPDQRTALVLFSLGYSYAEVGALKRWTYLLEGEPPDQ
jgi:DNA-directed RNA polymerase specialized sigma24 family protein